MLVVQKSRIRKYACNPKIWAKKRAASQRCHPKFFNLFVD
tara:strand:- start:495 stop:614 length:120 start_codon:yes stop_codon:yes gene_type:complete